MLLGNATSGCFELQYIKKEARDQVDFLACRLTSVFLQVDFIVFDGGDEACQSTQKNKFAIPFPYLKKKLRDEIDFCADKHRSLYKLILLYLMDVLVAVSP